MQSPSTGSIQTLQNATRTSTADSNRRHTVHPRSDSLSEEYAYLDHEEVYVGVGASVHQ
jgi:hypothetical protein